MAPGTFCSFEMSESSGQAAADDLLTSCAAAAEPAEELWRSPENCILASVDALMDELHGFRHAVQIRRHWRSHPQGFRWFQCQHRYDSYDLGCCLIVDRAAESCARGEAAMHGLPGNAGVAPDARGARRPLSQRAEVLTRRRVLAPLL